MNHQVRHVWLMGFILLSGAACTSTPSAPPPATPAAIVTLSQYPRAGAQFLVDRNRAQEVWRVADDHGTIEFLDPATRQLKLTIQLGPCFSLARMPRHDFSAAGKPAFLTAPPDCQVWNGRVWPYDYKVHIYAQPCSYTGNARATVTGEPGRRLVTTTTWITVTGPGVRGGQATYQSEVSWSEERQFFKELAPGYIGRAVIIQALH